MPAVDSLEHTADFDDELDEEDDKDYLASRSMWFLASVLLTVLAVPAAGLILLTMPGGTPLHAPGRLMTPTPLALGSSSESPAAVLPSLADRVRLLPPGSDARFEHVSFREWRLDNDAGNDPLATAVPRRQDVWLAADGTGRRTSEITDVNLPLPRYDRPLRSTLDGVEDIPPGEDPAAMVFGSEPVPQAAAELTKYVTRSSLDPWDGTLALYRERVLPPASRAAVLKMLAGLPGVSYRGTVADPLGRRGVGLSRTATWMSSEAQQALVFDEETGELLAAETLVTSYNGKLRLSVPAVVSLDTFLSHERTDSMGDA